MKNDDEFEMLLGEIPHATSSPLHHHHHHHHHPDAHHHHHQHNINLVDHGYGHASCMPRRVNSLTHTHSMYDEELLKHKYACASSPVSGLSIHSDGSSSSLFSGGGGLSFSDLRSPSPPPQIEIRSGHLIPGNGFWLDFKKDNNDDPNFLDDFNLSRNFSKMYISDELECGGPHFRNGVQSRSNRGPMNFASPFVEMQHDQRVANLLGPRYSPSDRPERLFPRSDFGNPPQFYRANVSNSFPMGLVMPNVVQLAHLAPPRRHEENTREGSLVIHGEHRGGQARSRGQHNNNNTKDVKPHQEKMFFSFSVPSKCSSLLEVQGYIYPIAKDQHGCRFLQRMFDEGNVQDVQIVFNEIIDHVVELMMNPFGNYLMQKLLEVCNEEHRMHILLRVTEEPGELVRISLNTHGTRVVQKLIETLKTRQQISLVISALEPGFLALIKDLNGNHVVQRCLQCFTTEDSKFIFIAAAKYCVEIATHQHGCCVLQRCITYATGELRENLVEEISANGLLLAQDAYGNYVVQFILELKIPSITSKLTSQFEGHYVHLSRQKFSSHVVEKCLALGNEETRSKIIHELLSAAYFEQLLQDPHANYVVQTALRETQGRLHNSLVEAVESYKAFSRNSPYSKRIFSHKLLKSKKLQLFQRLNVDLGRRMNPELEFDVLDALFFDP
ncbi:putative pumilio homolog 7 chloroplastic [Phtheirospermum japonicum]|uniref:Putative pumilio homolog 7 chloroplastic n=1 Tax=Phtheirospermum japonicum TaxID=374723 RepID=A0A830CKC7_9LAMI|nr:putative pumilio homolog 7 chloroplastic [Phtheirospermum japonicum]